MRPASKKQDEEAGNLAASTKQEGMNLTDFWGLYMNVCFDLTFNISL